ncbi:MGMT family protein [Haloarculaceae archaeon H-GB2-1]|nr:MGMT family protein [Haloarculaceae archaeon H-GB1-1]MEA5387508.1 MGMT family protein [Haloarculaceae archaeon H-GB11]MEA5408990.1 MGMT family protein [Haloarculaceae archaeon H-GB2-1]
MEDAGIYAREFPYLDRHVQLGVAQGKVISVSFPQTPDDDAGPDHPLLDRIEAYLEGTADDFDDVELALTMPTEQRTVLEAVREIPHGESADCGQLARMAPGFDPENDDDMITIRTALDENPLPLLIPDHRIRDGPSASPPDVEQKLRSLEGL